VGAEKASLFVEEFPCHLDLEFSVAAEIAVALMWLIEATNTSVLLWNVAAIFAFVEGTGKIALQFVVPHKELEGEWVESPCWSV
jgi:hypothetical protein